MSIYRGQRHKRHSKLTHWGALWAGLAGSAGVAWIVSFIDISAASTTTGLVPTSFGMPTSHLDGAMHLIALGGMPGGLVGLRRLMAKRYGLLERRGFRATVLRHTCIHELLFVVGVRLVRWLLSETVEEPPVSITDP